MSSSVEPRGRYAPSPTGPIHLGNARTALVAWLSVRSQGGSFVWRLEDLDGPRVVPGLAQEQMRDLRWLGLDWDEGPDIGGPHRPYEQSGRLGRYDRALELLHRDGHLFPCRLSRRELREIASAPHGRERSPYPAALRPETVEDGWFDDLLANRSDAAARFRAPPESVEFVDRIQGARSERVDLEVGDFVLRRRDGVHAYQLAVVVDDLEMEIDEIVRGADLLDSTARQLLLVRALRPHLGGPEPVYAHVPLMLAESGDKLSKRDQAMNLGALRDRGIAPERVCGYLAHTLGLRESPVSCAARELIESFSWASLGSEPTIVPSGLCHLLADS